MLKSKLIFIKSEIDKHKHIDLFELVQQRLNKTFVAYVSRLELSYNRLLQVDELKVLKAMSKEEQYDRDVR